MLADIFQNGFPLYTGILGQYAAVDLPFQRVWHRCQIFHRFGEEGSPLIRFLQIVFAADLVQLVLDDIACPLQQQLEPLGAELFQVFVGVLGALHREDPGLDPHLFQKAHSPAGSGPASAVRIVGNNDFLGITGNQTALLRGECRAQCSHHILKAGLMNGNHVHIAFCQNQLVGTCILGKVERKEVAALLKD